MKQIITFDYLHSFTFHTLKFSQNQEIQIPIKIFNNSPGKTLLITAGMDGDEYTGIEAALKLSQILSKKPFLGKIIIVPIVNIPAFNSGTSYNPLDNKYPKHIFPGNKNGSPSEKLIHWLSKFVLSSDAWLDFHSGGLNEKLLPYIYTSYPDNNDFGKLLKKIILTNPYRIVCDKKTSWPSFKLLRKKCIIYLLSEFGDQGETKKKWINAHCRIADSVMSCLGMMKKPVKIKQFKQVYTSVEEFKAKVGGIWQPYIKNNIQKHDFLGVILDADGKRLQEIKASSDGIFLYAKLPQSSIKEDILYSMVTKPEILSW